jgi:hypothetical protein
MNQHDRITRLQYDLAQHISVVTKKVYGNNASLNHKHLLQVANHPGDGFVIVGGFYKS